LIEGLVDTVASMSTMAANVVRELDTTHLVLGHKTYKTNSRTITKTLGRIFDILVTIGKVVCQMIFLVVDTDNYNLLLGLDFLMEIGVVVDLEKGVIQIQNKPSIVVEVMPLNVVNMLHRISRSKVSGHDRMRKDFNKMNLEQCCADEKPTLDSTSTFSNYANCINDSFSEGDLKEKEENVDNNLYKILFIEEILIEELNDYDMNQTIEN
jgi:hypothetical protein